jgi:hypothetical protein
MSTAADAEFESEAARRRRSAVAWGVLLTSAVVIYELTTQPALAGLALALKAGLRDFRTALWLRLRDPVGSRGAAHSWLFVCTATGLTCLAAFLILLALGGILAGFRLRPRAVVGEFARGCALTLVGAFAVSVLAGAWAAVRAWAGGHRLWVSPGVHDWRRADRFPPRPAEVNGYAAVLALTACGVLFGLLPVLFGVLAKLVPGVFAPPRQGPNPPGLFAFLAFWWAVLVALLVTWNRLRDRLTARSPADAWPDPPASPDPADPYWDRWANG